MNVHVKKNNNKIKKWKTQCKISFGIIKKTQHGYMKTSNLDKKKRSAICKTDSCPKEKDKDRNSHCRDILN